MVDKLTVIEHRMLHTVDHERMAILREQRDDLIDELDALMCGILAGRVRMKVYRQFKKYGV